VTYYENQKGPLARAEEIYHRLRLGEAEEVLDVRWMPNLDLRGALGELGPSGRLWLSKKLNVTPDKTLLSQASQEDWELHTWREAERFLEHNAPKSALDVLGQRADRMPGSALFRLEAEARLQLGDRSKAADAAQRGYQSAAAAGNVEAAIDLRALQVVVAEGQGQLEKAFPLAEDMAGLVGPSTPALMRLKVMVMRIRIRRELTFGFDAAGAALILEANTLIAQNNLLPELRRKPSLLRETTAELGQHNRELLSAAISVVGVDTRLNRRAVLEGLAADVQSVQEARRTIGAMSSGPSDQRSWLSQATATMLEKVLIALPHNATFDTSWLVETFRSGVSETAKKRAAPKKKTTKRRRRLK
jgi:hypothetical protein